jgi:cell wall-associated NlpC family hydrolase
MKIDQDNSTGKQFFNVPNTPEGLAFIALCRKYLNKNHIKGHKLSLIGRGPRPSPAHQSWVPKALAKWFAVYLPLNDDAQRLQNEETAKRYDHERAKNNEITSLKAENNRLKADIGKLVLENDRLKQEWSGKSIPAPIAVAMPSSHGRQVVVRISVE